MNVWERYECKYTFQVWELLFHLFLRLYLILFVKSERVLARAGQAVRQTLGYALGGGGVVTGGIRATSRGLCAG